eukprot:scaffold4244_cov167-Amphora_coffeaeformis.AAC.31
MPSPIACAHYLSRRDRTTMLANSPSTVPKLPMKQISSALVVQHQVKVPEKPSNPAGDDAKKVPTPEPAPVAVLKEIFAKSEGGRQALKRPSRCMFSKPSQDSIDAYNIRAVRAIREKNVPLLRTMLEEGISLDACNRFGESLLHMACRRGDVNVVRFLLLEGRVNINVRDDFGRSCLHDACWTAEPNFAVMDVLLEHCPASLLLSEDVRSHTPFHYARKEHWGAWVSYLKEKEPNITALLNMLQVVG